MKSPDHENIEIAQGYLEHAVKFVGLLRPHLRGTDRSLLEEISERIEQAKDVLENGY